MMRYGLMVLVGVWGVAGAKAAEEWPIVRGPARDPQPYTYNANDWKKVPKDFIDDATACYLLAATTQIIEPDGTYESITHEVIRLNSRKAVEELGEHRTMIYTPAYDKLTLNVARVHKADGKVVEIEPKHVHLRDIATDYLVYASDKQLIVSFPNLAVGDVLEVKWTTRGRNPEYQGHFFNRYGFGDERYPIFRDVYQVQLPKDRSLKTGLINTHRGDRSFKPVVTSDAKTTLYTWTANVCRPLATEENAPSREEARLTVAVSTMKDWNDVLVWKRQIRAKCWECTNDVKQIVADATKGLTTPRDKAKALTHWVRKNIRYISAGEKHDYTPHTPTVVCNNRFGDCKDTSQLLAVLLKEAGIPSALVTLGVKGDGQVMEEVPSPWGTHAILLVTIDGRDHWIDTTATLCGWDFLPVTDRDRLAYVVDEQGIRLLRTPKMTADENRIEQTTVVNVQANGDSVIERTHTSHGLAALSRRDDFVDVPVGERRRLVLGELQDANNKSRLKTLELDEQQLRDHDAPVTFRTSFSVPNHLTGHPLREGSISDSPLWAKLLSVNVDAERTQAIELYSPFVSKHRIRVVVPYGRRLRDDPDDRVAKSPWGSFQRTVKIDANGRQWDIEFTTRLEQVRVEPKDLEAFRQWQEKISRGYRVYLTMEDVTDRDLAKADAQALATHVANNPNDIEATIMLIRLNDLAGATIEATKIVDTALAKHPKNRELLEVAAETARTAERSELFWTKLIEQYPSVPKYSLRRARDLISFEQRDQARTVLEPLLKHDDATTQAEAYYQLARLELADEQPERARTAFTEASKRDGRVTDDYEGHLLSGYIYEAAGQFGLAAKLYQSAIDANDQASEPWRALASVLVQDNKKSEARDTLRRWFVLHPNTTAADWVLAAELYLRLGDENEALALAQRAAKSELTSAAQRVIGLIRVQRREWAAGLTALAAVKANDYNPAVFRAWTTAVIHQGELTKLSSGPGKLLSTVPNTAETIDLLKLLARSRVLRNASPKEHGEAIDYLVCAEKLYQQGETSDAERLLATATKAAPECGAVFALRALMHTDRGRFSKALPDAEKAIKLLPDEALGYMVRGRIKLERGVDGALTDLRKAVELSQRKDGKMLYWLAYGLTHDGRKADAKPLAEAAKQLLPKDNDVEELLQSLKD